MKVMAIRTEAVPGLRPSSCIYMQNILSNPDVGIKSSRKDFVDKPSPAMTKVTLFCVIVGVCFVQTVRMISMG